MSAVAPVNVSILQDFPSVDEARVNALLTAELAKLNKKIVVLDDDPTGVQTVHNISVYTNWQQESLNQGFAEENSMFFILTNSRSFTEAETLTAHAEMAEAIAKAISHSGKDAIIISRSDSTLRGHYPLEPETLRQGLEKALSVHFDGEVICPFFKEGGRFTINDIHYVKEGDQLTPAGQTEFARDKSFGYTSSNLLEWCEEKSKGKHLAKDTVSISLQELRALQLDSIEEKLCSVQDFGKVIVNAIDYIDVKIFAIAFCRALARGKRFMLRSAAAITKVLGNVPDKPLLTKEQLLDSSADATSNGGHGGIVLIGSHTKRTTEQWADLKNSRVPLEFLEFNAHSVLEEGGLEKEVATTVARAEDLMRQGRSVVIYTSRTYVTLDTEDKDRILATVVKISNAVTSIIGKLKVKPAFIIAKGGITSSDVGTKALKVVRATVMGQVKPGIPVWLTGPESTFPHMPYVIFPGNVGEVSTLREIVETLAGE